MDYSSFLQMREEFSLLAVMVFLLIYDIFASEKALKYFQPVALVLLTAHTIINCFPRDAFEIAGGMFQYVPMQTYVPATVQLMFLR